MGYVLSGGLIFAGLLAYICRLAVRLHRAVPRAPAEIRALFRQPTRSASLPRRRSTAGWPSAMTRDGSCGRAVVQCHVFHRPARGRFTGFGGFPGILVPLFFFIACTASCRRTRRRWPCARRRRGRKRVRVAGNGAVLTGRWFRSTHRGAGRWHRATVRIGAGRLWFRRIRPVSTDARAAFGAAMPARPAAVAGP